MVRPFAKRLRMWPVEAARLGLLYTTIERLENKGLLKTWMGEAAAQRGGRAKRMVRVTPKGLNAAKEFYEAMMRVSRNASWATGKPERVS